MEEIFDQRAAAASSVSREAIVSGAMMVWAAIIAVATYNFRDARAVAEFSRDAQFIIPLLSRLPSNIGYLFPVLLFLSSCFGPGDMLLGLFRVSLRTRVSRLAFAVCLGLAAWTIAIVIVGMAGFLTKPPLYAILAAALLLTVWRARVFLANEAEGEASRSSPLPWQRIVAAAMAALLVFDLYLALVGALGPEVQFDARYYHLAEAIRYVEHGRLFDLVGDTHSDTLGLYQYQETLYAGVIAMFGLPAAKVLSWSNLLLSIAATFAFAVEFFRRRIIGLFASLLFVSTPIVTWSSSTASNDLSQVPFTVLAVFSFLRWKHDRAAGWLALGGALCGYAWGVKPFGAFSVAIIALFVFAIVVSESLLRDPRRTFRLRDLARVSAALAPFLLGSVLAALPSIIRTTMMTWNPLFPLATSIFHTRYWSAMASAVWSAGYQPRTLTDLIRLPWAVTIDSDRYRQIIGPIFLFAFPFVLLATFWRSTLPVLRQVVLFAFLWLVLWYSFGTVSVRYAEPLYPLLTILIAFLAFPVTRGREGSVLQSGARTLFLGTLLLGTCMNTQILVPFQRHALHPGNMGLEFIPWRVLYAGDSASSVTTFYDPILGYVNSHLDPTKDKIYDGSDGFQFNSYSDIDLFDGSNYEAPASWNLLSPNALHELRKNHIDYVMVFARDIPPLSKAPLFAHLRLVHQVPVSPIYARNTGAAGYAEALYKVK